MGSFRGRRADNVGGLKVAYLDDTLGDWSPDFPEAGTPIERLVFYDSADIRSEVGVEVEGEAAYFYPQSLAGAALPKFHGAKVWFAANKEPLHGANALYNPIFDENLLEAYKTDGWEATKEYKFYRGDVVGATDREKSRLYVPAHYPSGFYRASCLVPFEGIDWAFEPPTLDFLMGTAVCRHNGLDGRDYLEVPLPRTGDTGSQTRLMEDSLTVWADPGDYFDLAVKHEGTTGHGTPSENTYVLEGFQQGFFQLEFLGESAGFGVHPAMDGVEDLHTLI